MTSQRYRQAYQAQQYEGMSKAQLVLALLEAALRATERAKEAIAAASISGRGEAISRALAIVGELQGSLDLEQGHEVAQNLFALYDYAQRELVAANLKADPAGLDHAAQVLREIRDGWAAMLDAQAEAGGPDPAEDEPGSLAEYA